MEGILGMIKMSLHPGGNGQWLLCDGSLVAVDSYPALFAMVGYKFGGQGDQFALPDLRGDQAHYLLKAVSGPEDASYVGLVSQMVLWVGEELPVHWLPCDGRPIAANTYPMLQRIVSQNLPGAENGFHLPRAESIPGIRYIICSEGNDPNPQPTSPNPKDDDDY